MKNLEIVGLAFLAGVFALKVAAVPMWISAADVRSATKQAACAKRGPAVTRLFAKLVGNAKRAMMTVWTGELISFSLATMKNRARIQLCRVNRQPS